MTENKPAVYTPAQLGAVANPNKPQAKQDSGFNMGFLTEVNKLVGGLNTLMGGLEKAKGLTAGLTGAPSPNENGHIQTKIEKGVDNRMARAKASTEPQREAKIAVHVGNATKEFIGFTDLIFSSIDEDSTIKEAKEQLKENMSEETIAPIVENFLIKHTELYYE